MLARSLPAILCLLLLSSVALAHAANREAGIARGFPVPPVRARAAAVIDADTGRLMMGVNAHQHLAIASTTKVMTALLALQLGKLSDRITVPGAAFNFESDATVMGLHAGQVVTLRDLLYGLLLPSGADAANTIAIHYAGSEAHFVQLMNREAANLGMRDTHYVTAHGLDAPGQYSSAYDLATLGEYVSALPQLMRVVDTPSYSWDGHILSNLNHVILWYPGADGIKPGFTYAAGLCQVLDAHRDGRHVVVAVLNTPDMVIDARDLLNFALRDFSWAQTTLPGDNPGLILTGFAGRQFYSYFTGSGHYVRGPFWSAFRTDGGLETLGFPRTEQLWEGPLLVQYFQNGALALDGSGRVHRLALGLTPLPTPPTTATPSPIPSPTPVASPSPTPTPSPTVVPGEGSVPVPTVTSTPSGVQLRDDATPPPAAATPTPAGPFPPGRVFTRFYDAHANFFGSAVSHSRYFHGYITQVFAYGALVYDRRLHVVSQLPIGDRLLAARHFLPGHPGNIYPQGFADAPILNAVGWLP
ncbi:MAG: hypothetical protein M3Z66_20550 [Chloroflexota bacterium]|nr:hypothetical protein [Chloroflexota bacterium]